MNRIKKIFIVFDAGSSDDSSLDFLFDEDSPHRAASKILDDIKEVEKGLKFSGYSTVLYDLRGTLNNLAAALKKEKPDLVFNFCESIGDDDPMGEIRAACFFELLELPYTGSSPFTLVSALDKVRTKEILNFYKIANPKFFVVKSPSELNDLKTFRSPLIIKPVAEDGSIGIDERSLAKNPEDLRSGIERICREFHSPALVEEFIEGREFQVAIWGNKKPEILPISEIDFSGLPRDYPKILTYASKWRDDSAAYQGTPVICPANLSPALERKIKDLAFQVYRIFECRDYARIDFRLDKKGHPHVLEVNPNPDIALDSGFYKAAAARGYDYAGAIKKIVDFAAERL